jgi:HSP20 family protein
MSYDLIPSSLWNFPLVNFPDDDFPTLTSPSGISISEDDHHVFVTAALPGVEENDIETTYNKGILWVKGETEEKEEDKKRKFYRRSTGSFSYRIAVPGEIDHSAEPEATFKNGVLTIKFSKSPSSQPKKITVKKG